MRSIGNWAAGKYVQPEDRIALRDKLLERFKTILGGDPSLPKMVEMDDVLNQADDPSNTPHHLVL